MWDAVPPRGLKSLAPPTRSRGLPPPDPPKQTLLREDCHPEPLSSTPQSNSSFVGAPVWAKDLPRCVALDRPVAAPYQDFPAKEPGYGDGMRNIPGDPSPNRWAQDDSLWRFWKWGIALRRSEEH